MATIEKRGKSYRITVSAGYDSFGKQVRKKMTWKPSPNMTPKQIEKEVAKQAVLFEQQVETGQCLDNTITFSAFADKWFKDYAEKQLKPKTVSEYKGLMQRINAAIGFVRLAKLQPHHLIEFYNNLAETGVRRDTKYKSISDIKTLIKETEHTQKSFATACGVSISTIEQCIKGANITQKNMEKIKQLIPDAEFTAIERNNNRLSDKTISEYHRLISAILTTAVQWQVIFSNPCSRVKPPRVERKEAIGLDEIEAAELIQCLQSEPLKYKTAVMLTLYTGMRRGELCGLDWSDVDFKNKLISITKAVTYTPETGLQVGETKTTSSKRIINIPNDMIVLLKEHRREQLNQRFSRGDLWQNTNKVFTNTNGGLLNPDTMSAWFKKFVNRHNLPDIHFHNLRHTAATLLIAGGVDIATVSKRLGHADKTTTLNIYTHAVKSADAAAAELLQNIFSPTPNSNAG